MPRGASRRAAARSPRLARRWVALLPAVLVTGVMSQKPCPACAAPASAALDSSSEINRKVTNPVSTTWSLKWQNNVFLVDVDGHGDRVRESLVFQPSLPVLLGPDLKLIPRPKFTFIDSKPYTGSQGQLDRATGFGDTVLDLVLSPRSGPWLLALGGTFVFPTATLDQTGQGKWQAGPAGVLGHKSRTFLAGVIFQQWFSYAGPASRRSVSEFNLQYIASYFFNDGWSIGTSPTIKVNWRASPGSQVSFPFGPTLGKVVKLGGVLPVKFEVDAFYFPVRPDSNGNVFQTQLTITPVVPSPFGDSRVAD